MRKTLTVLLLLACVFVASNALAHSYKQGDIEIGHIWTHATAPGMTTAAIYVPLLNIGKQSDILLGASSDLAEKIEIYQSTNDNGIMKNAEADSITLEPNKPVSFRPGGLHFMVFGLKRQLKEGEMFPITIQFKNAGTAKVDVMVQAINAMSGN